MNTEALSWPEPAPALARAVSGEFRLLREIGRGGMGVVYLAEDTQLQRKVAIKTLPPHLAADASVRERFLREARTAAALSHPNIVPIYSASERSGAVYFTMGYVHGESLAERLSREGPLEAAVAVAITRQLALALEAAHAVGVVHRDIKAENVLLDGAGRAVVTDFGIARLTEAQSLTATGTVLGTVQYMSPEQVTGDALDGRSDLYALGVLLFRMLTGRFPFERNTASAVLVAHVNSAPPRVHEYRPDAPDALDALVAALLEKRAADRVPSARALLEGLEHIAGGAGTSVIIPAARVSAAPDRLSSSDAEAVWARAAELQANTGMFVPPAQFPPPSESVAPTRGYEVDVVKEAAAEAGIPVKYVDRALMERQSAAEQQAIAVVAGERMRQAPGAFLGAHTKLEFESVLEAELPLDALEDLADLARRSLGDMITVSAVGRTLTISTATTPARPSGARPRTLQITVAVRNGRTTIRAFEDIGMLASGLMGGLGGGVGMGAGTALLGAFVSQGIPLVGLAAWAGILTATVTGARALFVHNSKKKAAELQSLVHELAKLAQAQIVRALPPGPRGTSGGR